MMEFKLGDSITIRGENWRAYEFICTSMSEKLAYLRRIGTDTKYMRNHPTDYCVVDLKDIKRAK